MDHDRLKHSARWSIAKNGLRASTPWNSVWQVESGSPLATHVVGLTSGTHTDKRSMFQGRSFSL